MRDVEQAPTNEVTALTSLKTINAGISRTSNLLETMVLLSKETIEIKLIS